MITDAKFKIGDKVNKKTGYLFPGFIVAVFLTSFGAIRYVVEATGNDYAGMLHIFNEEQLQLWK